MKTDEVSGRAFKMTRHICPNKAPEGFEDADAAEEPSGYWRTVKDGCRTQVEEMNMKLLVKKAQQGDADAFIELIERNKMTLQRIAYGYFRGEEDVADAIQDTILDAFEHMQELKKPEYFRTWLVRILMNNCNQIYNRNRKSCRLEELPEIAGDISGTSDVEFHEMLRSLPEDSRVIFLLYYGEQFTTREIGQLLNMKEATVKSRLHRGKQKLRAQMQVV